MIFGIIRLAIWLAGFLVIIYLALPFIGYEFNWAYFQENKLKCEEALKTCQQNLVKRGLEGAKQECDFKCADYRSIIQKKKK